MNIFRSLKDLETCNSSRCFYEKNLNANPYSKYRDLIDANLDEENNIYYVSKVNALTDRQIDLIYWLYPKPLYAVNNDLDRLVEGYHYRYGQLPILARGDIVIVADESELIGSVILERYELKLIDSGGGHKTYLIK